MELQSVKKDLISITDQINSLIQQSETLYDNIYLQLPIIEREIEITVHEMSILLEYFISIEKGEIHHRAQQDGTENLKIANLLQQIINNFSNISDKMVNQEEIKNIVDKFMASDQTEQVGIEQLIAMINQIKSRIIDIEIVSLNAIIYSARLGDKGKGLGVISDNIMSLSNTINKQFTEMGAYARQLNQWNESFIIDVRKLLACHNRLTEDYLQQFRQLFEMVFESLNHVSMILSELINNVEQAVRPIQELMISIQAQDIMRQYLENANKCLLTLQDNIDNYYESKEENVEEKLKLILFCEKVFHMVHNMLMNVEGEFYNSLNELGAPLTTIRSNLSQLKEEGNLLSDFLGGSASKQDQSTIEHIFLDVKKFIDELIVETGALENEILGFSQSNDQFYTYIKGVSDKVKYIQTKVGFLDKLKLMSRIELARIGLEDSSFGYEIARISDLVIKEVNDNKDFITSLQARLEGDLRQFSKMMVVNSKQVQRMREGVSSSHYELDMIATLISDAVLGLGGAANRLINEVDAIAKNLEHGAEIPIGLSLVVQKLDKLHSNLTNHKEQFILEHNLQDYRDMGREYEEILNNFTTYLERLTASKILSDTNIDIGSEAGELTLF